MKAKHWKTDAPDLLSGISQQPPLRGRLALCLIALSLVAFMALSEMFSDWNAAIASPPSQHYVLLANPSATSQQAQEQNRDRFMRVAPANLDERAIATARSGIDERIILDPYRNDELRTAAVSPVPNPGTPRVGRVLTPKRAPAPRSFLVPIPANPR